MSGPFLIMDVTVRSIPEPAPISEASSYEESTPNIYGASSDPIEEPLEDSAISAKTLDIMGIDEPLENLPSDQRDNLDKVSNYLKDILKSKGITPTRSSLRRELNDVKLDMGLDPEAGVEMVLDRIGGVVRAWQNLTFISDPREKKSIFMRLARQPNSQSMNRELFKIMEAKKVWL